MNPGDSSRRKRRILLFCSWSIGLRKSWSIGLRKARQGHLSCQSALGVQCELVTPPLHGSSADVSTIRDSLHCVVTPRPLLKGCTLGTRPGRSRRLWSLPWTTGRDDHSANRPSAPSLRRTTAVAVPRTAVGTLRGRSKRTVRNHGFLKGLRALRRGGPWTTK